MAREGTRYMVRNGYILLEDLESWYESGFVTPDDTVRIFNANGDSKEFKISSLTFLYGSEHPFRRAAKLLDSDYSSSDSDEERAGPSTVPPTVPPPKKVGGAFGAKRSAAPESKESEKEQKSVPQKVGGAFGVRKVLTPPTSEKKAEDIPEKMGGASEKEDIDSNESEGPMQSELDIQEAFEKFPNFSEDSSSTVEGPSENPEFQLSDPPLSNLYWKKDDRRPRVPLMNRPNSTDLGQMIERDRLADFYQGLKGLTFIGQETAKLKPVIWKCYYCCSGKGPTKVSVICRNQWDAFNHILKNEHKKNMQFTAPESDFKFWNDWIDKMNLGSPECPIYCDKHPLFNADNEPEEDRITGQQVIEEMEQLKLQFSPKWTKHFNSVHSYNKSICRLCNFTPFTPRIFYLHLFNESHISELAKCQISKKSFEFWRQKFLQMKQLDDAEKENKEKKVKEIIKFEIRKESAKFGNISEGLNMVDRKWDNPGIPLLDPPIKPVAKLKQDQFIRYYKSLSKAMTNPAARQIAQLKKVNWKCGYCSSNRTTVSFSTELEAFDHILGQKHKEKMKFTAPLDDLLFWGNWAVEINNELTSKEEEDQKQAPEDPTSSGSPQKPMTSSVPTPSLIIRNNPRVALMDPPVTTDRFQMCRQDKFVHFCNELSASLTEIGIKTANSRHANWKCGYCSSETDTVVCNTQFDAFNHVLKQKHKEKMKFTAPELDFKFWCDWVDEMNSGASESTSTVVQNLPELQKPESQVSQRSAAKVPENSNEQPRVPLLAPMPKNENMVSKKEFNEILDECAKMFQAHKQRLSAAKNTPAFVACSYCSKPDAKPLAPSNIQDQLLHILKLTHRENMQYKACLSDLQYWKSWVENYGISNKALESRKSPPTVPPKLKNGLENNEPFKKGCNNPRVPLLDVATNQGKLMKQIQYKEHYAKICEMLKERNPCAETEKSIKCICFHCPGDTRITTVLELLKHVFNGKHAENIRFIANKEDFTYYEDIIRKMPRIQGPAAVSRTPVSVVSPIQKPATVSSNTVPQEAKTAVKPAAYVVKPEPQFVAQGEQRILQPSEPIMDPISAPIPTDPVHRTVSTTPPATQAPRRLCTLPLFVSRRPKIEGTRPTEMQLSFINGLTSEGVVRGLPYVADGTYCGFCDEDMTGWDVGRIALHAFSDSHLRTLRNFVYISDFQHWIDMLERRGLSPSHLAAYVVRPDPPQPETQQQIPEIVPTRCELPLYVSYPKRSDAGPLISQVSFINSVGIRGIESTRPYVPDGTYCGFCNVDMQKWNLMSLARHAFSVRHLRKLGNLPHSSDFQYWIDLIKSKDFRLLVTLPLPLDTFLGLNSMMAPNQYDDFSNFSPRQMELISNVDMEKIEKCAELLNEFGGCISCEKWLLTGREVFEHWTKEIKQHLFVSRARMDVFMACVEKFQKEASPTTQALKPAPVSSQTIAQASIGQRIPNTAHVVRQDSPIVPQCGVPQQIIQVVRTRCNLPLYGLYPERSNAGPLNSQVSYINRVAIRGVEATRRYVANGTFCGSCNMDMTGWNLMQVVQHGFSVSHLRKNGNLHPASDFQHWIDMIKCKDIVLTPQLTPFPLNTFLLSNSMKASNDFDVFSNFSPRQMELISNVDMEKIEKCGQLLNEFGGCIYCEKWLLTGREVFEHWVPQQHFLKIRQQHPVSQNRMDIFMGCVEKCQKEKSGCTIM